MADGGWWGSFLLVQSSEGSAVWEGRGRREVVLGVRAYFDRVCVFRSRLLLPLVFRIILLVRVS